MYIYIYKLYVCPYVLASDPFNIFMGSVLAGFIIGIQEFGILYSYSLSSPFFSLLLF